jgi:hypothetical protein
VDDEMSKPTAWHEAAEAQDTLVSRLVELPAGAGATRAVHFVPFQDSASGTGCPVLRRCPPTAMHDMDDVQLTDARSPSAAAGLTVFWMTPPLAEATPAHSERLSATEAPPASTRNPMADARRPPLTRFIETLLVRLLEEV